MPTTPDAKGLKRYVETDSGASPTFSGLLNLGLGWISDLFGQVGGRLVRNSDLGGGVIAASNPAVFTGSASMDDMTWLSSEPTRLTVIKPGTYILHSFALLGASVEAFAWHRINGSIDAGERIRRVPVSGGTRIWLVDVVRLHAGDYIELMVQSDDTWTLFADTRLEATRISARVS